METVLDKVRRLGMQPTPSSASHHPVSGLSPLTTAARLAQMDTIRSIPQREESTFFATQTLKANLEQLADAIKAVIGEPDTKLARRAVRQREAATSKWQAVLREESSKREKEAQTKQNEAESNNFFNFLQRGVSFSGLTSRAGEEEDASGNATMSGITEGDEYEPAPGFPLESDGEAAVVGDTTEPAGAAAAPTAANSVASASYGEIYVA